MDEEDENIDSLLQEILDIKGDLLLDWFDDDPSQFERIQGEIRKTMSSQKNQSDHSVNFIIRLMSDEYGYRDESGMCRKRVDLALLFVQVMKESDYWNEFLDITRAASFQLDLDNGPLLLRAASRRRTGLDQIKEKYRQQYTSMSLCDAAKLEDVEQVKALIESGALIETDVKHRYTPLHYAAMAINPNAEIAKMLVNAMEEQRCLDVIDKPSDNDSGWNTALHIAAGNANVTLEFIGQFRAADPTLINYAHDTPFHLAAKSSNPKVIVYMLNTFAPTSNGWDVDDVDDCISTSENSVINICARSGNSEAIALLIQHGADISKGVLHEIVIESVKNPENIEKLNCVYQAVVDNAVTWRCLAEKQVSPLKASTKYEKMLKQTMIWLLTNPLPDYYNNEDVLQCAISHGALVMFQEIVKTKDVFRQVYNNYALFDVTNFTQETMIHERPVVKSHGGSKPATAADYEMRKVGRTFGKPHTPGKPYLTHMLSCFNRWKATNILGTQPLKQLTKPYFALVQRFYILVGLLQMLFMILFSVYYIPNICSLSLMFAMNSTLCSSSSNNHSNISVIISNNNSEFPFHANDSMTITSSTLMQQRSLPPWFWLIWPIILVIGNLVRSYYTVKYAYDTFSKKMNFILEYTAFAIKLCKCLLQPMLLKIFCLTVFVWFFKYCNSETHESYVEVTAMVLLFGWITDLRFFGAVNKNFSVSTLMIKEIIAKDIPSFMLFFIFTVVGFSFAMHALRVSSCDVNEYIYLWETFSGVLSSGFGIGDFFENTISSSSCVGARTHHLLEAVYFSYIVVTLIILLNLLIAMMNNRYEIAKQRAENIWRYQILCKRGALQSHKIIANIVKKCRIPFTPTKNRKFLLCCFCCCFYDKNPHKITKDDVGDGRKRYYLKVRLNADEH